MTFTAALGASERGEAFYLTVFSACPDLLVIVDAKGRLVEVNPAVTAATGYSLRELLHQAVRAFISPSDRKRLRAARARLSSVGKVTGLELRCTTRAGRSKWFEWNLVLLGKEVLASGREISHRKKVEETLELASGTFGAGEQGYWVRELDEDLVYWSVETRRIFGLDGRFEQIPRQLFLNLVHPEDRERLQEKSWEALNNQNCPGYSADYRIVRQDGAERRLLSKVRILRDAEGSPRQAIGTVQDVTGSRFDEASLKHQQGLNSALFDATGALMMILDTDGYLLRVNGGWQECMGYPEHEVVGRHFGDFLAETELAEATGLLGRLLSGDKPFAYTNDFLTRDGVVRSVAWLNTVLLNEQGAVEYVLATGIDITELRDVQRSLIEAREHYKRLVTLSFDCIVTSCDDLIVEVNPAGARLLGATSTEQIIGLRVTDLLVPEQAPAHLRLGQRLFEFDKELPLTEYRLRCLDGRLIEVEVSSVPMTWEGRPATQSVIRDITRRKCEERDLREREHHFQTLAKASPVGIFESDVTGKCVYVNERYLEITGFGYRETLEQGWQQQLHPADVDQVLARWEDMLREGRPFRAEYRLTRHDGCVTWVLGQAIAERDSSGRPIGYVGTITDITRNKLNEIELQRYREKLEQMVAQRTEELAVVNHELESFSYSVSHDLRAPLRAINGFNSALMEEYGDKFDEQALYYLQRISVNSKQMSELIDDLLQLSKVSQVRLERHRVDLTELAETIVAELQVAEPEREVAVKVRKGLVGWGDPRLLQCLLQNLIGNAWKYTCKNPQASIEINQRRVGGVQVIYVKDNGVGFDMECAENNLFRAFHRLHHSNEFEGTGIGLATVQRIVNRHGGRVWAEAEEGKGAVFYFVLGEGREGRDPFVNAHQGAGLESG